MSTATTLGAGYVVPEEERSKSVDEGEYRRLLARLSHQSVVKHFDVPPERVVVQIVESRRDSKSRGGVPFSET